MGIRTLFRLWLPLAVSFELMMLEGPTVQAAMGWLPNTQLNLAAWGLTFSLCLIIESPVIMLLSTAIALVQDAASYHAVGRFMRFLCYFCTALSALVGFTPLFHFIAIHLMGQPEAIATAAQPAMQVMLLWPAAIAWRRFYQGILIRYGETRKVSWGTAIRLTVTVCTAVSLCTFTRLPGALVASIATLASVLAEAVATTWLAMPLVRRAVLTHQNPETPPLTQRAIFAFHAPLAATTLLTLLAQPLTATALARLADPKGTLAAWPVAYMTLLVIRGWGFALQEIAVAHAAQGETARTSLRRFTWMVGLATSAFTALIVLTPLHRLYLTHTLHLHASLQDYAQAGVALGIPLPLLTALASWRRGVLVARKDTRTVYVGMGINLALHCGLLLLGIALRLPGIWAAVGAFTLSAVIEYVYLAKKSEEAEA